MNTLIVYDSLYGNTEQIAQAIADVLGQFGQVQAIRVDRVQRASFEGVDLLIVGSPTHGMQATPTLLSFLQNIPASLSVTCFDTRFRGFLWKYSAAPHMARELRAMGIELLVPPESFFVKTLKERGPLLALEEERAARWALDIQHHFAKRNAQPILQTDAKGNRACQYRYNAQSRHSAS